MIGCWAQFFDSKKQIRIMHLFYFSSLDTWSLIWIPETILLKSRKKRNRIELDLGQIELVIRYSTKDRISLNIHFSYIVERLFSDFKNNTDLFNRREIQTKYSKAKVTYFSKLPKGQVGTNGELSWESWGRVGQLWVEFVKWRTNHLNILNICLPFH